jgi:chromatin remodeling complex protein RSC6
VVRVCPQVDFDLEKFVFLLKLPACLAQVRLIGGFMPKTSSKKRKPNAAFMRPVQPDEKLSAIVGSKPLPRTELTKKLWKYIKKNGCQDKKKRTMINADDALRAVFNGKRQVSMFEMTKLVSKHTK